MKLTLGIIAIIILTAFVVCGFVLAGDFNSDIPTDDNAAPSCRWSDAVLDVDDYMDAHRSAAAEIYLEVEEKGEEVAKSHFLANLYSMPVSKDCGDTAWDWLNSAYLKFEEPGHTSMDPGWLNG